MLGLPTSGCSNRIWFCQLGVDGKVIADSMFGMALRMSRRRLEAQGRVLVVGRRILCSRDSAEDSLALPWEIGTAVTVFVAGGRPEHDVPGGFGIPG